MSRAFILVGLAALAGCSAAEEAQPNKSIRWRRLADSSQFAIQPEGTAQSAARCWRGTSGYDCIEVTKFSGMQVSATRFHADALPASWPIATPADGYECSLTENGAFDEQIGTAGGKLASNSASTLNGRPAWSRSWAEKFMRDNRVSGAAYFDCRPFLKTIGAGSLQTLWTSNVQRGDID